MVDAHHLVEVRSQCDAQSSEAAPDVERALGAGEEAVGLRAPDDRVHLRPAAREDLVAIPPAEPLVGLREDRPLRIDPSEVVPVATRADPCRVLRHLSSMSRPALPPPERHPRGRAPCATTCT